MPLPNKSNPVCPYCDNHPTKKIGKDREGRQRYRCNNCLKIFTLEPKLCVVCGSETPRDRLNGNTCSETCWEKKRRDIWLEHYYRRVALDPDLNRKRHEMAKARPEFDESMARQHKNKWERIRSDPEKHEKSRERARLWYAQNKERVQAQRKARLDAMSPDELNKWMESARKRNRAYRKKWHKELRSNPELHQQYLDRLAEYRRRRALAELLSVGTKIQEKFDE